MIEIDYILEMKVDIFTRGQKPKKTPSLHFQQEKIFDLNFEENDYES